MPCQTTKSKVPGDVAALPGIYRFTHTQKDLTLSINPEMLVF